MDKAVPVEAEVDLTNCDREPIHLLGRVQNSGFLLAVTADWLISKVSANISKFLEVDPESVIGEPASSIIGQETIHTLRNRLQGHAVGSVPATISKISLSSAREQQLFDVSIHSSGKLILLEFEPAAHDDHFQQNITTVQQSIQRMASMPNVDRMLKYATRVCSAITGYDRVMAYIFREDGTGEVRAETHAPDLEPYVGLRYPASDIPKQARELYVNNLVRSIDDSNSLGSEILPLPTGESDRLDLSNAVLRSVSPIHLEYLRNMGVAASLSISLVLDSKLYGLIACHHRDPKHPSASERSTLVLMAQMLSLVIAGKRATEEAVYKDAAMEMINNFSRSATSTGDMTSVIMEQSDTALDLMSADGLAVLSDGKLETDGFTPTGEEIRRLAKWLNTRPAGEIYSTNELASLMPEASEFATRAAGMLSIPISKTPRDYIMFFRREVVKSVTWAGDPSKPVALGPNGARLTPRKSFEAWQSIVEGQCEEWAPYEIAAAEQFRVTVLELVLSMVDEAVNERQKANEKQELLIAELNHRVRNILGLVQSLIAQTSKNEGSVKDFAKVLESRIQAMSRAHDQITKKNWSSASFRDLIAAEAGAYLNEKSTRLEISGPDVEIVPAAFSSLALVMHELITNSAKYGALSDQRGRVDVALSVRDDGSLDLRWQEFDGPPVKAPSRRGFGTVIIERSIPFELNGKSTVSYDLAGLSAHFWIPAVHITNIIETPNAGAHLGGTVEVIDSSKEVNTPFPKNILLVEDNMIIAMDTESVLVELGAENVRVCSDVESARTEIGETSFDLAILDVNLGSETSLAIARKLEELKVPFMFASGYGELQNLGEFKGEVAVLTKPYDKERLKEAVLSNVS